MTKEQIEATKLLAEYDGLKYYPNTSNTYAGWWDINKKHSTVHLKPNTKLIALSLNYVLEDGNIGRYVCRSHNDLNYIGSYDKLFSVIKKLEKEVLSECYYQDEVFSNFEEISVERYQGKWGVNIKLWNLDPDVIIGECKDESLEKEEQLFWTLFSAIKTVNKIKSDE